MTETGLSNVIDRSLSDRQARHRLVEYNVVRQVEFLTNSLPETATVAGYVHDQSGAYGNVPNKMHLVTVDGVTDSQTVASRIPAHESIPLGSLLY